MLGQIRERIWGSGHGILIITGQEVMFHPCESKQSRLGFSNVRNPAGDHALKTPLRFCPFLSEKIRKL
jgi:hypothetical protein